MAGIAVQHAALCMCPGYVSGRALSGGHQCGTGWRVTRLGRKRFPWNLWCHCYSNSMWLRQSDRRAGRKAGRKAGSQAGGHCQVLARQVRSTPSMASTLPARLQLQLGRNELSVTTFGSRDKIPENRETHMASSREITGFRRDLPPSLPLFLFLILSFHFPCHPVCCAPPPGGR